MSKQQRVNHLVIDTNAIIHGLSLKDTAEHFYTCPDVINEKFLTRLPFEIKLENPSEESFKAVIALAHTIETRYNGDKNIRTEPIKTRPTGALGTAPPLKPKVKAKPIVIDDEGWETVQVPRKGPKNNNKKKKDNKKNAANQQQKKEDEIEKEENSTVKENQEEPLINSSEEITHSKDEPSTIQKENNDEPKEEKIEEELTNAVADITIQPEELILDEEDDDEDEGGEWITPENVEEFKAIALGVTPSELQRMNKMEVACMTSDFAMQNVLLQMNLNLVSTGGYRITKIKNWVLRCHGCFTVTGDVEKKFCPKCGGATLTRISCTTNNKGEIKYHLKANFQYNLRGSIYDIPPPQGGRKVNNLVLREDQREYMKAKETQSKKKIIDMFDPDFIPLYGKTGEVRSTGNNMFGTDVIGFGRKNPNQTSKRTGKGKKKRS
ncbi:unnamed protein product [Cunninghamella echinulata]